MECALDYEEIQELWIMGYSDEEILDYFNGCYGLGEIREAILSLGLD